eukprot:4634144-Prymnesium_polylepis.1
MKYAGAGAVSACCSSSLVQLAPRPRALGGRSRVLESSMTISITSASRLDRFDRHASLCARRRRHQRMGRCNRAARAHT